MRAWTLMRTMNVCFWEPVITPKRGGQDRGGAKLTPTGERFLRLYELLETEALENTKKPRSAIKALLKK